MRISTKGGGIIKAQQGTIARPNPKENYKLPEDQRYQAQTTQANKNQGSIIPIRFILFE